MTYPPRVGAVLFAKDLEQVATFYSRMLGLAEATRDNAHIRLESLAFELVVHRLTHGGGPARDIDGPLARRAAAAFKPVFFVPSISSLRDVAESCGGLMEPVDREWSFNGTTVCDGIDPEGNVIQFREQPR
jgi:catechol-2,3-dioxygenase